MYSPYLLNTENLTGWIWNLSFDLCHSKSVYIHIWISLGQVVSLYLLHIYKLFKFCLIYKKVFIRKYLTNWLVLFKINGIIEEMKEQNRWKAMTQSYGSTAGRVTDGWFERRLWVRVLKGVSIWYLSCNFCAFCGKIFLLGFFLYLIMIDYFQFTIDYLKISSKYQNNYNQNDGATSTNRQ